MKRTWITIDVNYLRNELGLPPAPRQQGEGVIVGRPPRPQPPERHGAEGQPLGSTRNVQCQVYTSFQEAHDGASAQIAVNPNLNLIIFESTSVLASVPTTPIEKRWNPNGELII